MYVCLFLFGEQFEIGAPLFAGDFGWTLCFWTVGDGVSIRGTVAHFETTKRAGKVGVCWREVELTTFIVDGVVDFVDGDVGVCDGGVSVCLDNSDCEKEH